MSPSHKAFGRLWYSIMADSENHRSALNPSNDGHFSGEQDILSAHVMGSHYRVANGCLGKWEAPLSTYSDLNGITKDSPVTPHASWG